MTRIIIINPIEMVNWDTTITLRMNDFEKEDSIDDERRSAFAGVWLENLIAGYNPARRMTREMIVRPMPITTGFNRRVKAIWR